MKRSIFTLAIMAVLLATGCCEGIFYWEPEYRPGQYKLGAFDSSGQPTVIMDGFGE